MFKLLLKGDTQVLQSSYRKSYTSHSNLNKAQMSQDITVGISLVSLALQSSLIN